MCERGHHRCPERLNSRALTLMNQPIPVSSCANVDANQPTQDWFTSPAPCASDSNRRSRVRSILGGLPTLLEELEEIGRAAGREPVGELE